MPPCLPPLRQAFARFCRASAGNVAVIIAVAVPAVATLLLGATDIATVMTDRQRMHEIADSAALAGARNLAVAMGESDAVAQARAMAAAMVAEWQHGPDVQIAASAVDLPGNVKGVKVTLDAHRPSFFNDLLPPGGWRFDVSATASSVGSKPLCVLVFTAKTSHDFWVKDSSVITAPDCLVHSNGNIEVSGGKIEAGRTQAVLSASGAIAPAPVTDAPPIADPFASLPFDASIPGCLGKLGSLTLLDVSTGAHTLPAGDHCGAILVSGDAQLVLAPGVHRFGLGSLVVRDQARLVGDDVVMILDKLWRTSFSGQATISLSGRHDGMLAGFVLVTDRDNTQTFEIDTTHVERLDGVLYVPSAELRISASGDVARQSDWTVIVAKNMRLTGNPRLYINADYAGSEITPPAGVGPSGEGVRLVD